MESPFPIGKVTVTVKFKRRRIGSCVEQISSQLPVATVTSSIRAVGKIQSRPKLGVR